MILKENYNGKTTLKQWWQIVRDNFRTIAENAVSKKELSDSVSEAITSYVSEDMKALEDIRTALAENADIINVLNSSITSINNHKADMENPHGVTAAQVGLSNVKNVEQASKAELEAVSAAKCEIVCGTYNITDLNPYYNETKRCIEIFINLGFTPEMVEIYKYDGSQTQMYGNSVNDSVIITGGIAMTGYPCNTMHYGNLEGGGSGDTVKMSVNHIEIASNGFYIRDFIYQNPSTLEWKASDRNSITDKLHYFKAYKNINIISTGDENDN